jgi:hypothetical protein
MIRIPRLSTVQTGSLLVLAILLGTPARAPMQAPAKKPNILVIMGDDIGWYNPSIYHRGDMG